MNSSTTLESHCNLLDLPVLPFDRDEAVGTNKIITEFIKMRKMISSTTELRDFIDFWKPIWLLTPGTFTEHKPNSFIAAACQYSLDEAVLKLLRHEYDADEIVKNIHNPDGCSEKEFFGLLCNLNLPIPGLLAFQFATAYGVGSDIGFVRLYLDTYPDLEGEGRPF